MRWIQFIYFNSIIPDHFIYTRICTSFAPNFARAQNCFYIPKFQERLADWLFFFFVSKRRKHLLHTAALYWFDHLLSQRLNNLRCCFIFFFSFCKKFFVSYRSLFCGFMRKWFFLSFLPAILSRFEQMVYKYTSMGIWNNINSFFRGLISQNWHILMR